MSSARPRVLLIAEAANPEWVSVPLVGWSLSRALAKRVDAHMVTQVRNRDAVERAGWVEGREFTALDSESIARPMWHFDRWLRRLTGLGWTTTTALAALPYYEFERRLWQRFGPQIKAGRFDVVHRVTPLSPTLPSLIAARCRAAGVPFVWGPLNGGVPWPAEFTDVLRTEGEWLSYVRGAHKLLPASRSSRRDAAAIIVGSRATFDQMAGHHDRCVYVPENGIDPDRFSLPVRASQSGPLQVAFIGRLVPYKGADMLIQAAAPLVRAGKVQLNIIGDGPQMAELQALVQREQLAAGVTLSGWVAHGDMQQRLEGTHLLGFPSVREFGGGVVLEAMAMGLVPLVVNYAGPGELVTDLTGYRVPLGDRNAIVHSLHATLARLAHDRSELGPIAQQARRRVLSRFTWAAKAAQIEKIYDWVAGRRSRPDFGMPFGDDDDSGGPPAPAKTPPPAASTTQPYSQ
jgi:glycosyltransferase involved in cell wall biosynthesis